MKIKSLWMSDLHLGTKASNADLILDVLKYFTADTIILNGDVVDFWQLGFNKHWTDKHNNVLRLLFKKAKDGTNIIYLTGNHDEVLRDYTPFSLDKIHVLDSYEYSSISNGTVLFIHGDAFDFIIKSNKWLAKIGAILYEWLILFNHTFNKVRKALGLKYWSLSKYLKEQTKKRVGILRQVDNLIVEYAKRKGYTAISAGHIHIPEMKKIDGVLYINTGDMCETGSLVIEHLDGKIELIKDFNKFIRRKHEYKRSGD